MIGLPSSLSVIAGNNGIDPSTLDNWNTGMHSEEAWHNHLTPVFWQDPGCVDALFALAVLLHDAVEFEAAARRLRELLKYRPDLAEVHFNPGTTLNSLGQREDAIATFGRAIELRPDLADAHNNLGIAYREFGQLEQAMISVARRRNIYEELHVGDVVDCYFGTARL
jgi:tetratricopeptide (TPR) repeat protein